MTALAMSGSVDGHDAVVVGVAPDPDGARLVPGCVPLPGNLAGSVTRSLRALGATGKPGEVTLLAVPDAPVRVVLAVGLGPPFAEPDATAESVTAESEAADEPDARTEALRLATASAVRALAGTARAALLLPLRTPAWVRVAGEAALLGAYVFQSKVEDKPPVGAVTLCVADPQDEALHAAFRRAAVLGSAVALARDLVNMPPNDLDPQRLADIARTECEARGLAVEVFDEEALRAGGFGGIVGVGQGSARPPRLVHVSYRGGERARTAVALVGKGVTFDSGGISLKAAAGMAVMKNDMAGAAAVIAAMRAIAELRPAVHVDAWVPMAENMPTAGAIRPSDVLTMRNGMRVEVNDTDAEGRLIMADALARACADGPDIAVDVATLTSAQIVGLGRRTAAVMANDDELRDRVVAAARRAGESAWGMPLPPDLRELLRSDVADMINYGPPEGGMLTAGLFLQEFVPPGVRWAHIDIAGPAYHAGSPEGCLPRGGTGAAVRTLVQVIEEMDGR